MRLRRPDEIYVRTAAELSDLWRTLMGPGGFGVRSLWLIFFYPDGQLSPVVSPVDGVPIEPDAAQLRNVVTIAAEVVADFDGTVAFLLSRPGPATMTNNDRRWGRALRAAVPHDMSPWPVHLGTRDRVQVFAPDDLIA